jgi:hypothetical protein
MIGYNRDIEVYDVHDKVEKISLKFENVFCVGKKLRLKKQVSMQLTI